VRGVDDDQPGRRAERRDPPLDALWAFWVTHLYDTDLFAAEEIDEAIARDMRGVAERIFVEGLRELGLLPRIRRRARVAVLGQVYGQAGAVLRMAQSETVISDERLESDLIARATNLWPLSSVGEAR